MQAFGHPKKDVYPAKVEGPALSLAEGFFAYSSFLAGQCNTIPMHTAHLPAPKSLAAKSRVSATSKLIETKRLQAGLYTSRKAVVYNAVTMRATILFLGTLVGNIAFQLSVAIWPDKLAHCAWLVKYLWMFWAVCLISWAITHEKALGSRLKKWSQVEKEEQRIETKVVARVETKNVDTVPGGPFLVVNFLTKDLFDIGYGPLDRDNYFFIRNSGNRTAFDVQVATLSRTWNGNLYEARFPKLQLLEADGKAVPITPTIRFNGEDLPIFSVKARIYFVAMLLGEDEQFSKYKLGEEIVHHVIVGYTDHGIRKSNSAIIKARYNGTGADLSVEHQS